MASDAETPSESTTTNQLLVRMQAEQDQAMAETCRNTKINGSFAQSLAKEAKHTCQSLSPNSSVPYSDGPCMACAKEKGLKTGLDDGPPNSTCMCGRGIKCPIHNRAQTPINLPALLESHKQLVENFSRLYLELCELEIPHPAASPFSTGWNAAILEARAVSSRWLAKAKEIQQ